MTTKDAASILNVEEDIQEHFDAVVAVLKDMLTSKESKKFQKEETVEEKTEVLLTILRKKDDDDFAEIVRLLQSNHQTTHIVQKMISKDPSTWLACENRFYLRRHAYPPLESYQSIPKKINILLIGKTGTGKSATANMILNSDHFEEGNSSDSVTKFTDLERILVGQTEIAIIDSPGLFDTKWMSLQDEQLRKIIEVAFEFQDGIHIFLVISQAGTRMTKEEVKTLKTIEKVLSKEFYKNCIVLLTKALATFHGPNKTLGNYVREEEAKESVMANLISKMDGRIVAVENKPLVSTFKDKQRRKLLGFIAHTLFTNGWQPYTNEVFQQVKRKSEKVEKRRLEELERNEDLTKMEAMLSSYLLTSYLLKLTASELEDLPTHLITNKATILENAEVTPRRIKDQDITDFFNRFVSNRKDYVTKLKENKAREAMLLRKVRTENLRNTIRNSIPLQPESIEEILAIEDAILNENYATVFSNLHSKLKEQGYEDSNINQAVMEYLEHNKKNIKSHKMSIARDTLAEKSLPPLNTYLKECSDGELASLNELKESDKVPQALLDSILPLVQSTKLECVFPNNEAIVDDINRQLRSQKDRISAELFQRKLNLIRDSEERKKREEEARQKDLQKRRDCVSQVISERFPEKMTDIINKDYTLDETNHLLECLGRDRSTLPQKLLDDVCTEIGKENTSMVGTEFISDKLQEQFRRGNFLTRIRGIGQRKEASELEKCIGELVNSKVEKCVKASDYKKLQKAIKDGETKTKILTELRGRLKWLKEAEVRPIVKPRIVTCLENNKKIIKEKRIHAEAVEQVECQLKEEQEKNRVIRLVSDRTRTELPGYLREHCRIVIGYIKGKLYYLNKVPDELYDRVVSDLTQEEMNVLGEEKIRTLINEQMQAQSEVIESCLQSARLCSVM